MAEKVHLYCIHTHVRECKIEKNEILRGITETTAQFARFLFYHSRISTRQFCLFYRFVGGRDGSLENSMALATRFAVSVGEIEETHENHGSQYLHDFKERSKLNFLGNIRFYSTIRDDF